MNERVSSENNKIKPKCKERVSLKGYCMCYLCSGIFIDWNFFIHNPITICNRKSYRICLDDEDNLKGAVSYEEHEIVRSHYH